MTPTQAIQKEIDAYSKNLDPKAKSRWKHGFVDGLKEALKLIAKYSDEKK